MSVLHDPDLEGRLAVLHARSDEQLAAMKTYYAGRARQEDTPENDEATRSKAFLSDKLVALERSKGEFCYLLLRAMNARHIVEIGTSYGISTLYLAAALRDNIRATGGVGVVTGTEYEPQKAQAARLLFAETGLRHLIDLREGDLRETLRTIEGPIDFVLVDIWIAMARPALELLAPHLKSGAIVLCDNTDHDREAYSDYFEFLNNPGNNFQTMTLPFDGGLELSVHCRG